MKRISIQNLKNWREKPNRKPLVLSGTRQVGKTWLLKEFALMCFAKTAYVNFVKSESARVVVEGSRIFTEFKGALTEQFVQQELRAAVGIRPFYWSATNAQMILRLKVAERFSDSIVRNKK